MNEITPAERVALDTLRATALAKMSDADFANLETEVASKGLRNLDGWFGAQVAKAVEQVLKHPGHANQGAHGGKGGAGSSSAPQSSAGGKKTKKPAPTTAEAASSVPNRKPRTPEQYFQQEDKIAEVLERKLKVTTSDAQGLAQAEMFRRHGADTVAEFGM